MGIGMSAMPMKPNIDTESLSSNARNTKYPVKDLLPQAVPRLSRSGRFKTGKAEATIERAIVFEANALDAKIVYAWVELML